MEKVAVNWTGDMSFEVDVNGFKIPIDADEKVGGKNGGPRPKPLILASLGGCTGMDVISILKKMRVEPAYFNVDVDGQLSEEHPRYYEKIHITYTLKGKELDREKVEKAVNLSQERYCGVSAMLIKSSVLTHEIIIEEA
ncbi:MAG: OsmC family protein [Bacteroidetes bacterium]|jgi:putative redox protein|nr:OsmC family protein [Bacteroidota bacterium]